MEPPPRDAFLIGSASNIKPLTRVYQDKISQLLSIPRWKVPEASFTSKRCFKPDIGFDGTVFACGDNVIVSVSGQETVVQLQGFMSVNNEGAMHSLLGHGVCYPLHLTDNGQVDTHYWSGFVKVGCQPHPNPIVFSVASISRKVILFPYSDNLLTVVDYMRHLGNLPCELIVPVYPERRDMVLIQGEYNGDIWHGHVQSVDFSNKTVDIFFFIPSLRFHHDNIYVREMRGRGARNTVAWGSIIGIAEGHWNSPSTWVKAA